MLNSDHHRHLPKNPQRSLPTKPGMKIRYGDIVVILISYGIPSYHQFSLYINGY